MVYDHFPIEIAVYGWSLTQPFAAWKAGESVGRDASNQSIGVTRRWHCPSVPRTSPCENLVK